MFEADISVGNKNTEATFYVIKGNGQFLLGRDTAQVLGVLLMRTNVNTVDSIGEFPKIRGIMVDIPIRSDAKPVVQAYRRIPVPLENVVNKKISDMVDLGIVEKVTGPSKWISPLVIVPRSNSEDIRICVDMRLANLAVDRMAHPMPIFDDFLLHLSKARVFSKIDVKNAFHQVGN